MTSYSIFVSTTASKEFKALQKIEQERIREKLNELAKDPCNNSNGLDTKKLLGTKHTYYRLRVGEYRIIYYLEGETIRIVRVANPSYVYSWLD